MGDASRKAIVSVQKETLTTPQSTWDTNWFDETISDKGYRCYIERMMRCPCQIEGVNVAKSDCLNCGGTGYFWISKSQSMVKVTAMNQQNKNVVWTAENMGSANISYRAVDKMGYMDKITLFDLQSWFTQVIQLKKNDSNTVLFGFTSYPPLFFYFVYLYRESNQPLKRLYPDTDYTIEQNKIVLNESYNDILNPKISVRYAHNPIYFVLDISRDSIREDSLATCFNGTVPSTSINGEANYVLNCMGRKAQYLFDSPNFNGIGLIDNTDYSSPPPDYSF